MNEKQQSNLSFVQKNFDEFTNVTTTTHVNRRKYVSGGKTPTSFDFQLRQIKTKDSESLLLDCLVEQPDWFHARKGKIVFNCDQENFDVAYHQSRTDVKSRKIEESSHSYCFEYGYYEITPALLKQICDAKILKIRVSGGHQAAELTEKWCAEFQTYCRQYYNNVFDASLYPEALIVEEKSGCFVATAAMGSYDDPAVQVLAGFRDGILMRTALGRQAVRSYYFVSPSVAAWMHGKTWACRLAKWLLVLPASKIVELSLGSRLKKFSR